MFTVVVVLPRRVLIGRGKSCMKSHDVLGRYRMGLGEERDWLPKANPTNTRRGSEQLNISPRPPFPVSRESIQLDVLGGVNTCKVKFSLHVVNVLEGINTCNAGYILHCCGSG